VTPFLPGFSKPALLPALLALCACAAGPLFAQSDAAAPAATGLAPRPPAPGTAPQALTLDTAIGLAIGQNLEISVARQEIQATDGAVLQAGLRPNPEASALEEDLRRGRRTTTLQLTQPFELGGKRAARTTVAERARDQAEQNMRQLRADVRASVVGTFHEVLVAQERVRLAEESVGLARSATLVASKRVLAGKVSPVEETRARVAEAAIRVELLQAEGTLRSARQRLSSLWGDRQPGFASVAGQLADLPLEPSDAFVEERYRLSPALRQARLELERRRAIVELEQARAVPDISVTVGAKRLQEAGVTQAVVGVSIPFPLFDRNQGNLAEALGRENKARDELSLAELRLATDIAQARERLRSARAEALTLERDALPGARSAFDAATTGFSLGRFSFLEALDAQRTYFLTRAQYLRALSDTFRAAADIERLLSIADDEPGLVAPTKP
jgi:cobalt-zinc-cadmium efflux system outer membrane protein